MAALRRVIVQHDSKIIPGQGRPALCRVKLRTVSWRLLQELLTNSAGKEKI